MTTLVLVIATAVLCLYLAAALFYVHADDIPRMDFFDLGRRSLGPASVYLAIALAGVLLVVGAAPEWRLPPLVIALTMTTIGMTRDVGRTHRQRRRTARRHRK